jgi:DHA1 family bicyclomycin/chloramphenicol resistance-like MFS transporter
MNFSKNRMLATLAFISAFPPLSTDLYLPALPQMVEVFGAGPAKVNLTLSLFFIFFAIGILIWGPLSEKYGRKPILYCGLVIYTVSSLLCSAARSCDQLILFRIFQAFGGGAATAVATAIVKDLYTGAERARVLAVIMAMVIIAPVVAPIMGSLLLIIASWRAIFVVLTGFGILALLIVIPLEEPLARRYQGSALQSVGRLFVVLKNPGFSMLLCVFSAAPMPLMCFIAGSSYVYIQGFGLSEQVFSLFFAANAVCAMLGPLLYIRISRHFQPGAIISTCFIVLAVSGIMVGLAGPFSPFIFAFAMMPATTAVTAMRAPSAHLMLEQQQQDTGSASSLINFCGMMMGSLGMLLVSGDTGHIVLTIGLMQTGVGFLGFLCWRLIRNSRHIVQPQVPNTL